jgi:hypothetical protein
MCQAGTAPLSECVGESGTSAFRTQLLSLFGRGGGGGHQHRALGRHGGTRSTDQVYGTQRTVEKTLRTDNTPMTGLLELYDMYGITGSTPPRRSAEVLCATRHVDSGVSPQLHADV